jgi:curved DNA-binding protein CbpA
MKTSFRDYYEALQLSPNVDTDTLDRVFRILAKRYHPDNENTGNAEKFNEINEAHQLLSDTEKRAAYDVHYEENRATLIKIFDDASGSDGLEGDTRIFDAILSLLYISRRRDVDNAGMGVLNLEKFLGCPVRHLEFHVWYLKQKGLIERTDNGLLAISVAGIDHVIQNKLVLRRDRLLTDDTANNQPGSEPSSREVDLIAAQPG